MSNILIEANKISKIYDADIFFKRGKNFHALSQVDFVLQEGDFVSIMGPSGSGKSTMLNCISTLDDISAGSLTIFNKPVSTLSDSELSTFRYKHLGFIFQNHNLISTLSIYDNIATPIMLGGKNPEEINEKIQELASRLNISHILQKKPGECSGGEKQRAAIARALVNDPKIVVCDEPTGNLDSFNSHEVLNILSELNAQGTTLVIVTHDNMIASYAKTLMYLRDSKIQTVLHRGGANQVDFFNEIVKVTTQDSLLKRFDNSSNKDINEDSISVFEQSSPIIKKKIDTSANPKRVMVYAIFESDEPERPEANKYRQLIITDEKITYDTVFHEHIEVAFGDIEKIIVSLDPTYKNFGVFSEYMFYVKLDVITSDQKQLFSLVNINDLTPLFTLFTTHNITIEDPIGIQEIYRKHPSHLGRTRYLQSQYKRLKNEFGLK